WFDNAIRCRSRENIPGGGRRISGDRKYRPSSRRGWNETLYLVPAFASLSGRIALLPAKEKRCLVDEDSDQPAFEGAFVLEPWWIARGGKATVSDRRFGFINGNEDAACDEMKQLTAARELLFEGVFSVFA